MNTQFVQVKYMHVNCRVPTVGGEARELLAKLLATSKQVLGSQHTVTKSIHSISPLMLQLTTDNLMTDFIDLSSLD